MALLHIAVLVGLARLNLSALQTVMVQQGLIPLRELLRLIQIMNRCAQTIRLMLQRNATQVEKRIL